MEKDHCDAHHDETNSIMYNVGKVEHANIWKVMFAIATLCLGVLATVTADMNAKNASQDETISDLQEKFFVSNEKLVTELNKHEKETGHEAMEEKVNRNITDIEELECAVFSKCHDQSNTKLNDSHKH